METEQTEIQLVQAARDGNMEAFKKLVVTHESKVAAMIYSILGATPEAADAGQEVFIRFYESLEKFQGQSSVGTYLVRIAINVSLTELKRRKRNEQRYEAPTANSKYFKQHSQDNSHDTYDLVHLALGQLEPEFRTVVTMRMIEGYSTEETATLLELPMGTVLSRLSRAQKKLKEILTNLSK